MGFSVKEFCLDKQSEKSEKSDSFTSIRILGNIKQGLIVEISSVSLRSSVEFSKVQEVLTNREWELCRI